MFFLTDPTRSYRGLSLILVCLGIIRTVAKMELLTTRNAKRTPTGTKRRGSCVDILGTLKDARACPISNERGWWGGYPPEHIAGTWGGRESGVMVALTHNFARVKDNVLEWLYRLDVF